MVGVGPLGCAPRVVWEGARGSDGRDCVDEVNELIQGYNAKLAARLTSLRSQLPEAEIVFCDVYKAVTEIISNPSVYGKWKLSFSRFKFVLYFSLVSLNR